MQLVECQNFKFTKENINIIKKKTKNLIKWLLVWYRISPPSVEYIDKELTTPRINKQNNKIQSNDLSF